jgi:hypothetical protein
MTEYNAIVYTGQKELGNQGYVKYRKISNVNRFIEFISKKYPLWVFFNLYDKKTNEQSCIKRNKAAKAALNV